MSTEPAAKAAKHLSVRGRVILAGQEGFTLVEVIAAVAVFAIAAMVSVSGILIGDVVTKDHISNADKAQQLRSAAKMMADDLVFAQWYTPCNLPPDASPDGTNYVKHVAGYAVPDAPDPADPADPPDSVWPAHWKQTNWTRVCIYYGIEGDALVRETYRNSDRYSRRTILTGLEPGSEIEVITSQQLIKVTLRIKKQITLWGGSTHDEYLEVTTQFFIPGPTG